MPEPLEQLRVTLKQRGQSFTKARQIIFAALQDKEPQTMHEIILACRGKVDRASVYRSIAVFEQIGIIQRLQIGWKYKLELSDSFHNHHHHLTCNNCGKTTRLPEDEQLERRLDGLARSQNFVMQGHQLEIQGRCQDCS
ncbi:MAG: transcriptional repressor [Patescibacteria group bacterium]